MIELIAKYVRRFKGLFVRWCDCGNPLFAAKNNIVVCANCNKPVKWWEE